ncbi:hypothetical protein JCM16303_006517 [Sporobolomyces ruberrimus]
MSRGSFPAHGDPLHTPSLPNFKLAEKLGQGAFGSVYKALNWTTGETCAVKQIDLSHIPHSDLPDIMLEIDLLKNLHHSNIVQYRGYARTDSALYIILEYCENGSLSAIIKKFGRFPESLVGLYALQVLQGLLYLHDQGVIHRDIKGSNILATKEGTIKLADFGVATRVEGPSDSAVVGSPYWMAPEVVDQTGATTASDIWSLGALVIELLTGKPPYHFLDPMPALFRIVNDDCPPLPEGASAVVRDFLVQCFQKDGNLRIGARKLLRHPWMIVAKKQQESQSRDRERSEAERSADAAGGSGCRVSPRSLYDDTVQQVQQWNEALKAAPTTNLHRTPRPVSAVLADENSSTHPEQQPFRAESAAPVLAFSQRDPHRRREVTASTGLPLSTIQPKDRSRLRRKTGSAGRGNNLQRGRIASEYQVADGEEGEQGATESDNWDNDFEGGFSISKIEAEGVEEQGGFTRVSSVGDEGLALSNEQGSEEDADRTNSITIRATPRKPSALSSIKDAEKMGKLSVLAEDYSDVLPDGFGEKEVASLKESQVGPSGHQIPSASGSMKSARFTVPSLSPYVEENVDDYSDVFDRDEREDNQGKPGLLRLQSLSGQPWLGDEDSDEEDPFAAVDETADARDTWDGHDLEANLLRDQVARQCALVGDLLEVMEGGNLDDYEVREAALQIATLLEDSEETRTYFKKRHGTLSVVESLQVARSREILAILLRILNLIVVDAVELEKLALIGGCSVVMTFASKRYSREIRLETALFIGKLCRTSLLTLQMFVSCRGLRTLVELLDEDYNDGKDLIWMAVDGLARVFDMNGPTPRNDFCRLLAQEGVLDPLSSALMSVCRDDDDLAESAKVKIVDILLLFAQSDHKVKHALATRANSLRLVKAASLLEPELLAKHLKALKNLSMLPSALDILQNANAIEMLVGISKRNFQGRVAAEIQNHTLHTLFNLCRLSKPRQEEAASSGAIPILQKLVLDNSPLKQFALPILCDFAHLDSRVTRKLLWQNDTLRFYLDLLAKDTYWINSALEAILALLQGEHARVEQRLLEPIGLGSLVHLFCHTKGTVFETMLEPYHRILRTSHVLTSCIATQSGFCKRLVERIERSTPAVVRLNLLRITKTVFDSLDDRRDRERAVKMLAPAVTRVAEEDHTVLASQLARSLTNDFAAAKDAARRTLVTRRGVSEGSAPMPSPRSSSTTPSSHHVPVQAPSSRSSLRRPPIPFGPGPSRIDDGSCR